MAWPEPAELLPHAPPMVLLDRVVEADREGAVAEWRVPEVSPWVEQGRLLRSVLLEVCAQTAAVAAGLAARGAGAEPRRGFLGGISGFAFRGDVRPGELLRVEARFTRHLGPLVRASCRVLREPGGEAAAGELTLALPE